MDTGTCESLLEASSFVHTLEKRQGMKVACLEEIAFNSGWLSVTTMRDLADKLGKSNYGEYLHSVLLRS